MPVDRTLSTIENVKLNGFDDVIEYGSNPTRFNVLLNDQVCFDGDLLQLWDWLDSGCPRAIEAVQHDGGPDMIDGAPSNGDLP